MFRNPCNSRGSSANTRHPAPRRRTVLVALVLLLAIGSAGQPVLAQGGDPDVSVESVMATGFPRPICVGEIGSLKVWVTRTLTEITTKWKVPLRLKGTTIFGTVKDSNIASLPQPVQTTGFVSDSPGEAKFEIRGVKAGATTIDFSAPVIRLPGEVLINNARSDVSYVDITVSVKVIACDFEFKAHSDFVVPTYEIHAVINRLLLKPDAQGEYSRTGVAVHWSGAWVDHVCSHVFSAPDSEANLTGAIDGNGRLVLTISYQASSAIWHSRCLFMPSNDPVKLNPDRLTIYVPVSSDLFEKTLRQVIDLTAGEATIVVAPQHTGTSQ